jgi:hypothetical protein
MAITPQQALAGAHPATKWSMRIKPSQPVFGTVKWAREWQRFSLNATNRAMGHYLHGCANLAMARSPKHAWAELHKTQVNLLRHSVDTIAAATKLWRD